MPKYLIYNTEQEALERAGQRGSELNLPYHQGQGHVRYFGEISCTNEDKWALKVTDYDSPWGDFPLSQSEQAATVTTFTPKDVNAYLLNQ